MSKNTNPFVSNSWTRTSYDVAEISHVWIIEKFSLCSEKVLYSSTFSVPYNGGNKQKKEWRLQIYPNGLKDKDYISAFLELMTLDEAVTVNFSLSLLDETGNCLIDRKENKTLSKKPNADWGFPQFIKRNDVVGKLPNDVLKVACKLSYGINGFENVSGVGDSALLSPQDPECNLSDCFGALLADEKMSDVTLSIFGGGEKKKAAAKLFRAHKIILAARSPYFDAMFKSEMKEKKENRVEIKDVKPEIFKVVLEYIYTGKWQNKEDATEIVAREVLVAADRFALLRLKTMAENFLISKVTVGNVSELLVFGDAHSADTLKTRATDFVAENLEEVMETEGWDTLIHQHPHLINELILKARGSRPPKKKAKSDD